MDLKKEKEEKQKKSELPGSDECQGSVLAVCSPLCAVGS